MPVLADGKNRRIWNILLAVCDGRIQRYGQGDAHYT
jgi:hypothetical protein